MSSPLTKEPAIIFRQPAAMGSHRSFGETTCFIKKDSRCYPMCLLAVVNLLFCFCKVGVNDYLFFSAVIRTDGKMVWRNRIRGMRSDSGFDEGCIH